MQRTAPVISRLPKANDLPGNDVVAHSRHPLVRGFAALWHEKRGACRLPLRSDFAFEDLQPWFGNVIIMDAIDGADDFRYRLIGTGITGFLDRDYTGRLVSECAYGGGSDSRRKVLDTFRRPLALLAPVFRSGQVVWATDRTWRSYDSVHCPLEGGPGNAGMTIGVLYFGSTPAPRPSR